MTDNTEKTEIEEKTDGKKKKKHILLKLIIVLLVLWGIVFTLCLTMTRKMNTEPMDRIIENPAWNLPAENEQGVRNILLIGTDARVQDEDSRSDAIILCSVCPKQRRIYLTSILRDCYVEIPGYGKNRINHAYQMGGPKLLIETIEQNFHIRVDNYAKVDFFSFVEIIDRIGGVEINVTADEVQYVNGYLTEINRLLGIDAEDGFLPGEGVYTLNGRQALAYSRIRYIGTDFARTERQRTVIQAAVKKLKSAGIRTAFEVSGNVLEELVTDISAEKAALWMTYAPFLLTCEVESGRVPFDGLWWNDLTPSGQEVLSMDMDATAAKLREMIYEK